MAEPIPERRVIHPLWGHESPDGEYGSYRLDGEDRPGPFASWWEAVDDFEAFWLESQDPRGTR